VFHKTHSGVPRPTLFVVIADNVLVVRVGMFGEVALDEVSRLIGIESQKYPNFFDVSAIESDWMGILRDNVFECKKLVWTLKAKDINSKKH
jgi:hypothetical protein